MYKRLPPAWAAVQVAPSGERIGNASAATYGSTLRGMNAWQRHTHFVQNYKMIYGDGGASSLKPRAPVRTDADVVSENHRFLWDEEDGAGGAGAPSGGLSWEQRLAKRYHDRLFKEYALADLSRYREGAVGLRWRTEREVLDGRGQFSCGHKACDRRDVPLSSYELHFRYDEHGQRKEALVKVRCCGECAAKLNYKRDKARIREELKRARGEERRERREERRSRKRRKHGGRESSSDDDDDSASEGCGEGGEDGGATAGALAPAPAAAPSDVAEAAPRTNVWLEQPSLQKSRGEEFEQFFDEVCGDLFL